MTPVPYRKSLRLGALVRIFGSLAVLALLAACSGGPAGDPVAGARNYRALARGDYKPPGPPHDPWGPYIQQAAQRFDVPEVWIREVMRMESGGNLFRNGELITSSAGAMGLMQVMPGTYEELRDRHALGDDPFEPSDNILAGTAYLREMYDIYGAPGFLAAYNAGPRRLDDYLANHRGLPDETRRYVAKIGANIQGIHPNLRSLAEQYAMNSMPINVPPGLRYGNGRRSATQLARVAEPPRGNALGTRSRIEVAELTPPPRPKAAEVARVAAVAQAPVAERGGFRLISSAVAAPVAPARGDGAGARSWAIQVGAFSNAGTARGAASRALSQAGESARGGKLDVSSVRQNRGKLYRARVTGLSQSDAMQACERVQRQRSVCVVLSPDAQS